MARILYIILIIFANNYIFAQSKIDSLKIQLSQLVKENKTVSKDSARTALIVKIYEEFLISDFVNQKYWADSLARFSNTSLWPQTKGFAFSTNAVLNHRMGQSKLAIINFEKARSIFEKVNKKAYYNVITNLTTIISLNLLNYKIEDSLTLKRYLKYVDESVKIAFEGGEKLYISTNLITKALYYMVQNRHDLALPIFEMAHKNSEKTNGRVAYNYYVSLAGQGICYLYLNQEQKGHSILEKVKSVNFPVGNKDHQKYLRTIICIFESKFLLKKGEFLKVKNYALKILQSDEHLNFPIFINQLNEILFQAYKKLGEPEQALNYFEKVEKYIQEEENKNFTALYAEWQLKYNDEKRQATIKTLENQQLQMEKESNKLVRNILIFSLLAGLGLVYYIYSNNLKLSEKNKQLLNKNLEIEEALFRGQSIERKRISADLHDNLGAYATAIKADVEKITEKDFAKNSGTLQNLQQHSEEIINSLRDTIWVLNKENITITSISDRLKNYVSKLQPTYANINIQIIENIENDIKISSQKALNIFRILQEGINNALKHSKAKNLTINILSSDILDLSLIDDGQGFNENLVIKGEGLNNMEMRAGEIGMKISIESSDDFGTKIRLMD